VTIQLTDLIGPAFYDLHHDIKDHKYTHYVLPGGRGSGKSSDISIEIILGIKRDPAAHAIVFRQVALTMPDSVYTQLLWAIDMLGDGDDWLQRKSPLRLVYKPTGQQIVFRGADTPMRMKSIKPPFGYFKFIWYEEYHEFLGSEAIRMINQRIMRSGNKFIVFYSYNPPKSINSWVNVEILELRPDKKVYYSHYKDIDPAWLGEQFIIEAEALKATKPDAYRHEYDGEAIGTGGQIFGNVTVREITDEELNRLEYFRHGIDWGFTLSPAAFLRCSLDGKRTRLYITDEIYGSGITDRALADLIIGRGYADEHISADSEDPKSVFNLYDYGLDVTGCKKWPGSVKNGIEFLQDLEEIIICPRRAPNSAREFLKYEYEVDRVGNFILQYPDKDNHTIDAVRYALVNEILARKESRKK
jgi:PBSX family phage terminase large subunit